MPVEDKVKNIIGELTFQMFILETRIEKLQAENEALKKQLEKPNKEKPK